MRHNEDSLNKRYLYKLIANFGGLAISVILQMIAPRMLGSKAYGDYGFLTSFFRELFIFCDMGTSIAFYNKLVRRPAEIGLINFYGLFIFSIGILAIIFIYFAKQTNVMSQLWPDQELNYIYLAMIFSYLAWIAQICNKITDAYAFTVRAEMILLIQKIIGLVVILIMVWQQIYTLQNYFFYQIFVCVGMIGIFLTIINKSVSANWFEDSLKILDAKKYAKEFYDYSHPLFIYSLVGMITITFDVWLLQKYGGSVQQGYFVLSSQIGAICFTFTSAVVPLLMREASIDYGNQNLLGIAKMFRKYVPLLYFITASLSCFVSVQADQFSLLLGGKEYHQAAIAVQIMTLLPIHQTYGQLNGMVFYATDQTRLYRNIGATVMVLGSFCTYILLSPNDFGMQSAAGLAIKSVVFQILAVNIQLYYISRYLGLKFANFLGHQLGSITILYSISWTLRYFLNSGNAVNIQGTVIDIIISGMIYACLILICVMIVPEFAGIKREDVRFVISKLKK